MTTHAASPLSTWSRCSAMGTPTRALLLPGRVRQGADIASPSRLTTDLNSGSIRMRIHLASLVLRCTYEHAHQTCSHTWHHPDMGALNNDQLDQQDQLVQEALCKILGVGACLHLCALRLSRSG
ncbi:hypothetical protein L1887_50666 [Cichorium endivia]|nr:hypothetical protein L1887_50666 [Cichorium endivia]